MSTSGEISGRVRAWLNLASLSKRWSGLEASFNLRGV